MMIFTGEPLTPSDKERIKRINEKESKPEVVVNTGQIKSVYIPMGIGKGLTIHSFGDNDNI